jgi:hypothetical protein
MTSFFVARSDIFSSFFLHTDNTTSEQRTVQGNNNRELSLDGSQKNIKKSSLFFVTFLTLLVV